MKSERSRLNHERNKMNEQIKDNTDKIKNNKQLPYLVANVLEVSHPTLRTPSRRRSPSLPHPRNTG